MPKYGKDEQGNSWKWFEPREIHYTREQVEWLYCYILTLRDGQYPVDPTMTGYQNAGWKASINTRAAFIGPAEIAAELDRRARHCWPDDDLLEHYYAEGLSLEEIARTHYITLEDCWNRMQRALNYIGSGKTPRWVDKKDNEDNVTRKGLEYKDWAANHWRPRPEPTKFRKHRVRVSHA
jgi:hypothetical protein